MEMKPFYGMTVVELMNTSLPLLELQLQEGVPPGLAAHKIHELASDLFTAQQSLRAMDIKQDNAYEWWKTYRAALTGFCTLNLEAGKANKAAESVADRAHGSLQNTTPGV